jgi:arylsulfatase A-like enzyme
MRAPGRVGLVAVLLASLGACRFPAPAAAHQRLTRLLPALGAPEFVTLDSDTRPATRLRMGEGRSCAVTIGPDAQFAFAVGVLPDAPRQGSVIVRVRVNGRELARDVFPAERMRWWNRTLPLAGAAAAHAALEIQVDYEGERGTASAEEPFVALAGPRLAAAHPDGGRRLIWISQDTLRADHLESYGYERETAPGFARRAASWTLFERGVSAASWTLPSLASQMTSRYPSFHGATTHERRVDDRFPSVFEVLAAQGFAVVGVTGNPFVSEKHGLARGFDSLVYSGLRADVVSRLALHAAEQWGGGDLALFVHYMDPHSPYQPPAPFDTRFGERYSGMVDGYNYVSAAKTDADRAHVRALYDGEIAYTDQQIGALLDRLEERGLAAGAVVAYSSDHGEELFERGAWGHAHTLHEELLHVPFAVRVPGTAPRHVAEAVSLIDLAPTLLEAFHIAAPASFQGRSLMPLLRGGSLPPTPLFSETSRSEAHHQVSVRDGRWKYAVLYDIVDAGRVLKREALFDLDSDPGERRPVARDLAPFRKQVEAFLARSAEAGAISRDAGLDAAEQEELRALGYVN